MSTSLQLFNTELEVNNYNNDFLILKAKEHTDLAQIGKAIFQRKFDFVDEVIVTQVEICLKLNSRFDNSKIGQLRDIERGKGKQPESYRLPIYFSEHEDWQQIESVTGFQKEEIILKLKAQEFSIAMFGFLPGFIYLDGLDPALHVPRKTVPSKYIKANSLAIGGKYLGLYSLESPGGWHVVGQLPIGLLKIPDLPPMALNLGDKIRLHPIEKQEYDDLLQKQISLEEYNAKRPTRP